MVEITEGTKLVLHYPFTDCNDDLCEVTKIQNGFYFIRGITNPYFRRTYGSVEKVLQDFDIAE